MAKERIVTSLSLDITDVRRALNEIQSTFSKVQVPKDIQKNIDNLFTKARGEVAEFYKELGKEPSDRNMKNMLAQYEQIIILLNTLQEEYLNYQNLSKKTNGNIGFAEDVKIVGELQAKLSSLQQQLSGLGKKDVQDFTDRFKQLEEVLKTGGAKGQELTYPIENGLKEIVASLADLNGSDINEVQEKLEKILSMSDRYGKGKEGSAHTAVGEFARDLMQALTEAGKEIGIAEDQLNSFLGVAGTKASGVLAEAAQKVQELGEGLTDLGNDALKTDKALETLKSAEMGVERKLEQLFGLTAGFRMLRKVVGEAYQTIKELDAAMTETAVVTDFTVADMWAKVPEYTKHANELGATTKGVYEVLTLFYQQGLDIDEAFALGTETLKLARIAGLDYAKSTDLMTSALRGFNMELTETSAQNVADVYAVLAAKSASNVQEIATAMSKTASLAHNVGLEFETAAMLLAKGIEATREPAETIGTALIDRA